VAAGSGNGGLGRRARRRAWRPAGDGTFAARSLADRTGELARAEGARVLFEPVNQISRARNAGAAVANGQWLVFVDADSFPSVELFAEMLVHIQSGRCIGGGATVELDQPARWAIGLLCVWSWLSRWRRWMAGSFIFCETRAFRHLGGFSQELFVAEEIDFSKRLNETAKRRGLQVIILHRHPLKTLGAQDSPLLIERAHLLPAQKLAQTRKNIQRSRGLRTLV